MRAEAEGQDPAQLDPQMYHVIFENPRYRVIEYRLAPGGKEPMHSHPKRGTGVPVLGRTDANHASEWRATTSQSKAGDVVWRDPVTHRAESIGTTEAHSLIIEPKDEYK